MKNIVIVGGGAGGIELATQLGQKLGRKQKAHITLVDKNPIHLWKPLLHEIATGVLDDNIDDVSYLAQGKRNSFIFRQGALIDIDRDTKHIIISETRSADGQVVFPQSRISYDLLVIAIGSECNDFGTPGVKDNCIFLDNHIHAKKFRRTMLNHLFRLSSCLAKTKPQKISVAIVGGGATGIELAAELFPMVEKLAEYGFANISSGLLDVTVIEASERILPVLPEQLSASIHRKLEHYGVKIMTKTMITKADTQRLYQQNGETINADIMVWAAGVKAPDFLQNIAGLETTRSNQLIVEPTLQTTKDKMIFAIGDCAACPKPQNGFTPPTAQAAHQMAKLCVYNIVAYLNGKPMHQFKYNDKGTIISLAYTAQGTIKTLGRSSMIVKGPLAHMIYRLLYRMHQAVIYGIIKTCRLIMAGRVFRSVRTTLKLD